MATVTVRDFFQLLSSTTHVEAGALPSSVRDPVFSPGYRGYRSLNSSLVVTGR